MRDGFCVVTGNLNYVKKEEIKAIKLLKHYAYGTGTTNGGFIFLLLRTRRQIAS